MLTLYLGDHELFKYLTQGKYECVKLSFVTVGQKSLTLINSLAYRTPVQAHCLGKAEGKVLIGNMYSGKNPMMKHHRVLEYLIWAPTCHQA